MSSCSSPPDPSLFKSTDELRQFIQPVHANPALKNGPIPTNKWWGNILSANGNGNLDPIYPSPYAVFIDKKDRSIACSYLHEDIHHGPINENGAISYYYYPKSSNLIFECVDSDAKFQVEKWDDLTVGVALSSPSKSIKSTFSLGQVFITMEYQDLNVQISSEQGFASVNSVPVDDFRAIAPTVSGHLVVGLKNGQKWVLSWTANSPSPIDIHYDKKTQKLVSSTPFTGIVQAAVLQTDNDLQIYLEHAGSYVEGGGVAWKDANRFDFEWKIKHVASPPRPVLHFSMEHHKKIFKVRTQPFPITLHSHTRGPMEAHQIDALDSVWHFEFPEEEEAKLSTFTQIYSAKCPSYEELEQYSVVSHLTEEIQCSWTLPASYYFKGKTLQKYGSLCLLASKLASMKEYKHLAPLASTALEKFKRLLDSVSTNTSEFPLVYETVYKGIVSSEGFIKHDINVEFGNAVYNDHHYHYGYFITAVAIAYHLDENYILFNLKLFNWINTLICDVLNDDLNEIYFPRFRHFNWYYGHSYSHGVTCMIDGKDEESTSEEINLLYGCNLFGKITKNKKLYDLSHLMLKLASLSHQTYFFISNNNKTHPKKFRENKISGILFDNKCDYTTWFSSNRECIHGIHMLPISPILQYSRPFYFRIEEWNKILSKLKLTKLNPWLSLIMVNYSMIDPHDAAKTLENCTMDDGLSRAYAIFYSLSQGNEFF